MKRSLLTAFLVALVAGARVYALGQQTPGGESSSPHQAVISRYCITCHNERLKTAGLMLDKMDVAGVPKDPVVWEKVVRKLRTGAMPPAGMPRPDKATYDSFATYLETELDGMAVANPNPGRPAVHRLNRAEYTNSIRDLLAMDINGEALLPPDDSSHGFDNIGDVLRMSPTLLERYLSAARKISRIAIGDPAISPGSETYEVARLHTQYVEDRQSESLPFGTRGGMAIRHNFPLDGEYTFKISLQRDKFGREYIIGLGEPHQLEVRVDGARVKLFTVGGEHSGASGSEQKEYELGGAESGLEVRFQVKAGTRLVGIAFLEESSKREGVFRPSLAGIPVQEDFVTKAGGRETAPGVASVTIVGPYDATGAGETASRQRIFVCHPTDSEGEEPCAMKILSTLAHRAYRRPVSQSDVQHLLSFYKAGREKGGFEAGIQLALERILTSLDFLVRVELDPANVASGTAYRVSDLELASRMAFFLWSSLPDGELLAVAEQGRLQEPAVLEQQVQRMLGDSRSKALVENFAGQWLFLRNMRAALPDSEAFPNFDENLREAFQRETELFLESMLREDQGVPDLLNANYTFVNQRLAKYYGIPGVYGSHFRRVVLGDENRWGLLGKGSILTLTSYANRTSPTLRGKWVLENILGTPPPPPPPDVPSLSDRGENGKILSVRERLEQHRANPVCAGCHSRMDPLGFALENFDAIGNWRTLDAGTPIDPAGALPDGTPFRGPAELRNVLLSNPEQFVTTFTEKLLTYALGRGLEYYDQSSIRKIVREAAPNHYRWSSLILGIIKSTPFQMRKSGEVVVASAEGR